MKILFERRVILSCMLAAVSAISILTACSTDTVSRTPSTAIRPSTGSVKPEDLSAVWETYRILKRDYVDQTKIDPAKISEAAIAGMTGKEPISIPHSTQAPSGVPRELLSIWDAYQKISRTKRETSAEFVRRMNDSAINGIIDSLDDPYTSYISPENLEKAHEQIHGTFEGIGAMVGVRDGKITIIAPINGSPAQKAGILPGDIILKVNGESTANLNLIEVVLKIRGPRGSTLKLQIQHEGAPSPVDIDIVRDQIQLTSVALEMLPNKIAHIEVGSFTDTTGQEFEAVLNDAKRQGAISIVLDLRNNPGGLLTSTVDVASQFLEGGLVLYEVDSKGERTDWRVKGPGLVKSLPTVVLVNASSASGAEVAAGALQSRGRAKLVGVQTFGKGSVNFVRELEAGGAIYVTHALWYTPSGNQISRRGLTPDIEARLTQQDVREGHDVQMEKALEVLKGMSAFAGPGT
ncbi:MAG: S41 family peptidase [Dehalococcoidia bacterium]|nr:S41 family peptidase [Dehalococcoidia bacterium]